ncbi:hypothetical protein [Cellulomonas sp. URHD0024]|uniref:hypothetical protein n=1 Tax=Cellulomonas sp. URHD0024 TaxID=1302620 RepID=UPI00041A9337|nr:hypothetical protein [Cellulomonas sp. URHD0024]
MTTDTLALLPDLDVATGSNDPRSPHATATLHCILASPVAPVARRRVVTPRRIVLAGAAAGLAIGAAVLPQLRGGDEAYATWTAAPSALTPTEQAAVADSCRSAQDVQVPVDVAVAERRGVWLTVLLTGADGYSALCVTDSSRGWFSDAMIGSVGVAQVAETGPRDVVATDLGTGTMGAGDVSLAAGRVGAEVVGVAYDSALVGTVRATVSAGSFALWFPGAELSGAGADLQVTYRDGTTATVRVSL